MKFEKGCYVMVFDTLIGDYVESYLKQDTEIPDNKVKVLHEDEECICYLLTTGSQITQYKK